MGLERSRTEADGYRCGGQPNEETGVMRKPRWFPDRRELSPGASRLVACPTPGRTHYGPSMTAFIRTSTGSSPGPVPRSTAS